MDTGTTASQPCAAMPNGPTAHAVGQRVLRRLEAALNGLPGGGAYACGPLSR